VPPKQKTKPCVLTSKGNIGTRVMCTNIFRAPFLLPEWAEVGLIKSGHETSGIKKLSLLSSLIYVPGHRLSWDREQSCHLLVQYWRGPVLLVNHLNCGRAAGSCRQLLESPTLQVEGTRVSFSQSGFYISEKGKLLSDPLAAI
jgi:hypothetical protein